MNSWRFLKELRVDQAFSVHIHAIYNEGLIAEFSWFSWHCTELAFLRPEGRCAGTFPVLFLTSNFYCLLHWDTLHIELEAWWLLVFRVICSLLILRVVCTDGGVLCWRHLLRGYSGSVRFKWHRTTVGRQEDWWVTFAIRCYPLVFKA